MIGRHTRSDIAATVGPFIARCARVRRAGALREQVV